MSSTIAAGVGPRDFSPLVTKREPSSIAEKMPSPKTAAEMQAEWDAAHPPMTAQQALASNVELPPAYDGNSRADNHVSKIHTEIKVNGKTVARVYNSGVIEIADEYRFISNELHESFAADRLVGPELAEARAARFQSALERHGVLPKEKLDTNGLMAAALARTPVVELLRASTAQTQQEWLDFKATEEPMRPGAFLSAVA